jgi:hypothetical protein
MLLNASLILLTEILWILCGMAFLRILQRVFPALIPEPKKIPLSLVAICGLIFSTFLATVVSLFMRINWEFQLFLLALLILYAITDRRWIVQRLQRIEKPALQRDFSLVLLFLLLMALVLATSADIDRSYDDGLYHLQSVLLISRQKAIPGLGLLHNRFASNSFWHITSAAWGYEILHPKHMLYFIATPVLMLNFLLFLLGSLRNEKNRWLQWFNIGTLLIAMAYMIYYRYDFGAVDNNLPSFILFWLVLLFFVKLVFTPLEKKKPTQEYFLLILIVVFAWTVKISTFMLVIPAAYVLFLLWKNHPISAAGSAEISLLLLLPWFARSLISSGYLVYPPPVSWLGLPVKWQMPFYMAHESAIVDMNWAKIPGASTQAVSEMSLVQWVPQWFQLLERNEILLLVGIIVSLLFFAFSLLVRNKKLGFLKQRSPAIILLVWAIASIVLWFFSYPAPRFIYGPAFPIIGSVFLAISFWLPEKRKITSQMWLHGSVMASVLIFCFLFIRLGIFNEIDYRDIKILPAEIPSVAIRQVTHNDFTLNLPVSGNQCWGTVVPCVPDTCSDAVFLLGETVFDGFTFIDPNTP